MRASEIEFIDTCPRIKGLKSERKKVKLNIVEVKTKNLDKNDELSWILLTSLPVNNYGDAFLVINYYSKRWHVENYFKVLKDGCCKVERASLRTFEKLEKYISLVLSNFLCKFNLALKPRKGFLKSNWVSLPVNFHS